MVERPAIGRQDGIYWYVLQTHSAAEIAFNRYVALTKNAFGLITAKNESEKKITLFNGSNLFFKSGQNFEDLRAETLDGAIIDEFRQQHPSLWTGIIRPMLARRKGWCDVLSTPNGFDHTKDLNDYALDHPEEWGVFHAPSTQAWWWTPQEIASAKAQMSEDEFAQEIGAEFREIGVGKVYKSHGTWNQDNQNPFTVTGLEWSPYLPIIVGLDFNVGLMAWELLQTRGNQFYFGDEIAIKNTNSEECAKVLVEKVKGHKLGVILIGDASGNARKTSAVGQTDYSIILNVLKSAGIKVVNRTPEANPPVKDRVNCMNASLKSADGSVNLWYNAKCKYFKRDLERVKWKDGTDDAVFDKKDPLVTHSSDAGGYPVVHYSALVRKEIGTLKVIKR